MSFEFIDVTPENLRSEIESGYVIQDSELIGSEYDIYHYRWTVESDSQGDNG